MEKKLFKKKTALIMKMTLLLVLLGFLQVTAKIHHGTNGSPELLNANAGIKVTPLGEAVLLLNLQNFSYL